MTQILAETQLQKATHEAQRACENLELQMDTFEQSKVADLKKIITEFIQVCFATGSSDTIIYWSLEFPSYNESV